MKSPGWMRMTGNTLTFLLLAACGTSAVPFETTVEPLGAVERNVLSPSKPSAGGHQVEFQLVRTLEGSAPNMYFGGAKVMGRLDGDDRPDFAVHFQSGGASKMQWISGATGAVIRTFVRTASSPPYVSVSPAGGDLNADGRDDLLVGLSAMDEPGRISIMSGMDGAILFSMVGPHAYDSLSEAVVMDDIDGDAMPDLAVGASGKKHGDGESKGWVGVYSGAKRTLIYELFGPTGISNQSFGSSLETVGDLDGDGIADLAIAAMFANDYQGLVFVHSGKTGARLLTLQPPPDSKPIGHGARILEVGDIDGDGMQDIAVSCGQCSVGGVEESGYVALYSGKTGALFRVHGGKLEAGQFGWSMAKLGDLDGDGVSEYAAGGTGTDSWEPPAPGSVSVFSGRTGDVLWSQTRTEPLTGFGEVESLDIDGDGLNDLLLSEGGASPGGRTKAGAVYMYRTVRK